MALKQRKHGKELLISVLERLRDIDPRIVPFDSEEVEDLELSVGQAVCDVFGDNSPECEEYKSFRISYGHISRGDTRADKQSKFEVGHPRAIDQLEELLELMERDEGGGVIELSPEELVPVKPSGTSRPATKAAPPSAEQPPVPAEPKPAAERKPAARPQPKAQPPAAFPSAAPRQPMEPAPKAAMPGSVLLLQDGDDDVAPAVAALLKKLGIRVATAGGTGEGEDMKAITGLKDLAFAIDTVAMSPKGALSGLTSVIGKRPRHESIFKLGLLVGMLGSGRVAVLFGGERPAEIPTDLFGVHYIPFKADGGWQISLVKILKATGFAVDANVLLE